MSCYHHTGRGQDLTYGGIAMLRRLMIALAVIIAWNSASPGTAMAGLHAGSPAPAFRGTDLNGVSRTLPEFRGQVVVLFLLGNT